MSAPRQRWSREELAGARERVRAALSDSPSTLPVDASRGPAAPLSMPRPDGPMFHAAAVRSRFILEELRALAVDPTELTRLQERSVPAREEGYRTLLPDARNAILRTMKLTELAQHAAPAGVEDMLQAAIRAAIAGLTPDTLRTMKTGQLAALLQIYDGVSSELALPPRELIERRLQLARLIEPLASLTTSFSGRQTELQRLRDYVGVLSTGSWISDGLRAISDAIFTPKPKPPFVIHGPGGVGKTTLTAKFILEHALAAEKQQFPFAYLDFDRPNLLADRAPTILLEATRQIGLQYDAAYAASVRLCDRLARRIESEKAKEALDDRSYVKDFAGFLETLEVREGPVLLVLDTFEEVQCRSDTLASSAVQFILALTADVPRLRVVVAGRTEITGLTVEPEFDMELTEFDHDSALQYLISAEVDPRTADLIAKSTRGNPLTLRLAIELYRREPAELQTLDVAKFSDEIVQTLLFDRILLHIADREVQKLAHPGLVLRRVTPEIIQQVLAVPCNIAVPDEERARALFDKLAIDSTLVTQVDRWVLVHRSDVRRLMLRPLRQASPDTVRDIHRGAIDYYAKSTDVISRAEYAYHRLSLADEGEPSPDYLTDDLEPLLVTAIEDFPLAAQAVVSARYGVTLSPEAAAAADQETWERITSRRVTELIRHGELNAAEKLLQERPERSANTDLLFVEAQFIEERGPLDIARGYASRGIQLYRDAGNSAGQFRMLLFTAALDRRAARLDSAHSLLTDAEEIARRRDDPAMLISVLSARWQLLLNEDSPIDEEMQQEMVTAAAAVPDAQWANDIPLLRLVIGEIGHLSPPLIARAMRLGALELRSSDRDFLAKNLGRPADTILRELATEPPEDAIHAIVNVVRQEIYEASRQTIRPSSTPSRNIKLKTSQREQLRDLFVTHYGSNLGSFLESRFSRGLESVTFAEVDDAPRNAMDLIRAAEREGWLNDLIVGLARSRFQSPDVLQFLDGIGVGPNVVAASGKAALPEKELRQRLAEHRVGIAALAARSCAVFSGTTQLGDGFLASGMVRTDPTFTRGVTYVFDRIVVKGKRIDEGHQILPTLAASLEKSPIDSARAAPDAPVRGSVTLPDSPMIDMNAPLHWLWRDETRGLCISGAKKIAKQLTAQQYLVEIESTGPVAGAPCFDKAMNVVAMHLGPAPNDPKCSIIVAATTRPSPKR